MFSRLTQQGAENVSSQQSVAEEYVRFIAMTAKPKALTTKEVECASEKDEEFEGCVKFYVLVSGRRIAANSSFLQVENYASLVSWICEETGLLSSESERSDSCFCT